MGAASAENDASGEMDEVEILIAPPFLNEIERGKKLTHADKAEKGGPDGAGRVGNG